jgi:hypothetical protein
MFQTHPQAELRSPFLNGNDGVKTWRSIELTLSKTYFLATVRYFQPEGEVVEREIIFTFLKDVIDEFSGKAENYCLKRLDLMSPGYINGLGRVALDPILEIWGDKDYSSVTYLLQDGRRLGESRHEKSSDHEDLRILLRVESTADQCAS